MQTILVKEIFKDDYLTRVAGEKLRNIILENFKKNIKTRLDFSDLIIASVSFFDEGIAKLKKQEKWTIEKINGFVILKNINKNDNKVLQGLLK
jgi:hypothetical protein